MGFEVLELKITTTGSTVSGFINPPTIHPFIYLFNHSIIHPSTRPFILSPQGYSWLILAFAAALLIWCVCWK
jgi:hypothetical protein